MTLLHQLNTNMDNPNTFDFVIFQPTLFFEYSNVVPLWVTLYREAVHRSVPEHYLIKLRERVVASIAKVERVRLVSSDSHEAFMEEVRRKLPREFVAMVEAMPPGPPGAPRIQRQAQEPDEPA
jgi:hypothetical protein